MSSEIFENREDDFQSLYSDIKRKVHQQLPKTTGESRKRLIRDAQRGLEECNVLIQEMEEEAKRAPPAFRLDMVSKVRGYRRDVDQVSQTLTSGNTSNTSQMRSATQGFFDDDDFSAMEDNQRSRLLAGSQSVNRTSESLARTHRVAAETDQIGVEIIDELGQQRESLIRTQDRLHATDSNLSKSRKILITMGKRLMTNKLILAVIILLELGILGGVIYWKFFSKHK